MEILLWLVPPVVVTVLAMAWVSWLGREGRGEIDREEALARLGRAMEAEGRARPGYAAPPAPDDRSSGVAVRAPRPAPPSETTVETPVEETVEKAVEPAAEPPARPDRHREAS